MEGSILYDGKGKHRTTEIEVRIIYQKDGDWTYKQVKKVELTNDFLILYRSIGNVYAKVSEIRNFHIIKQ